MTRVTIRADNTMVDALIFSGRLLRGYQMTVTCELSVYTKHHEQEAVLSTR